MAGVKGRSGGARPGAGRKPAQVVPLTVPEATTPLAFLLSVMNDPMAAPELRVKAATTAAQYVHTRRQDGGKKEEQQEAAKKVAAGRFGMARAPALVVSNH